MKKFFCWSRTHCSIYINDSGCLMLDWIWCGMCSSLVPGMLTLSIFQKSNSGEIFNFFFLKTVKMCIPVSSLTIMFHYTFAATLLAAHYSPPSSLLCPLWQWHRNWARLLVEPEKSSTFYVLASKMAFILMEHIG